MKTKWLERSLVVGPYIALVTSQAEFNNVLKSCGTRAEKFGPWLKTDSCNATVHWLEDLAGKRVCVVAIQGDSGRTGIEIAGLLVHEAVHIFQIHCQDIGESEPSMEFEAYSIQSISQQLMWEYERRLKC